MAFPTSTGLIPAGPFTTPFSASSSCARLVYNTGSASSNWYDRDRLCSGSRPSFAPACIPPLTNSRALSGTGPILYFPASSCPDGWYVAYSQSVSDIQRLGCCPSSYRWSANYANLDREATCYSSVETIAGVAIDQCGLRPSATPTGILGYTAGARVMYMEVGLASLNGSSSQTPTSSSSARPGRSRDKTVTAGAIAGIVIGAIAGIALLIAGLFFCLRRHRREQLKAADSTAESDNGNSDFPEVVHEEHKASTMPSELDNGSSIPPVRAGAQELHAYGSGTGDTALPSHRPYTSPPSQTPHELEPTPQQIRHELPPANPFIRSESNYVSTLEPLPAEYHPNIAPQQDPRGSR